METALANYAEALYDDLVAAMASIATLPTAGQKAALAGTSGTPGSGNKYVTNDDSRNSDARTPTTHSHTLSQISDAGTAASKNVPASGDAASGEVLKGNDSRLTNARTPTAHKATHATNGSDAISPSDIGASTPAALEAHRVDTTDVHGISDTSTLTREEDLVARAVNPDDYYINFRNGEDEGDDNAYGFRRQTNEEGGGVEYRGPGPLNFAIPIDMGGHAINGLPEPDGYSTPATKGWIDDSHFAKLNQPNLFTRENSFEEITLYPDASKVVENNAILIIGHQNDGEDPTNLAAFTFGPEGQVKFQSTGALIFQDTDLDMGGNSILNTIDWQYIGDGLDIEWGSPGLSNLGAADPIAPLRIGKDALGFVHIEGAVSMDTQVGSETDALFDLTGTDFETDRTFIGNGTLEQSFSDVHILSNQVMCLRQDGISVNFHYYAGS